MGLYLVNDKVLKVVPVKENLFGRKEVVNLLVQNRFTVAS